MKQKSSEKVVVISGGSGYLGNSIAKLFKKSGFTVLNVDIDITKRGEVKEFSDRVINRYGQIYCIIHAASAPLVRKFILSGTENDFRSQFSVNVTGAFYLFQNLSSVLIPGGAIIGITTKAIEPGTPYSASGSYVPAKYALRGLLRVLSNELKDRSIRVYALSPAFMPGGLNQELSKGIKEFIIRKSAPGDITNPTEVAEFLLELVSDTSGSLTGKLVTVPSRSVTDL